MYFKGTGLKTSKTGKSPATSSKLGSGGQAQFQGEGGKYYQTSFKKDKALLSEHKAYEEMLER